MNNFDGIADSNKLLPPGTITMDRLGDIDTMIVSQATSQWCRVGCCQPSINFTLTEGKSNISNYDAQRQEELGEVGAWIAEEASCFGRTCSMCAPGSRKTKHTVHSGRIPQALVDEEQQSGCCCKIQWGDHSDEWAGVDPESFGPVIFTHEKERTNGSFAGLGDKKVPCCCFLPYLETKDASGRLIGKTQYVCDAYLCVPKYDVFDGDGNQRYRIRPDTCIAGCCPMFRCGGKGGKCCRIPFIIRDPVTLEACPARIGSGGDGEAKAQITSLWTGIKRACQKKNAYALHFPADADPAMKATLIGANVLIDMTVFEQEENN